MKTWHALRARGVACGRHRVARLRRQAGIEAKRTRRFRVTTQSRHRYPVATNLLDRAFAVSQPNRV